MLREYFVPKIAFQKCASVDFRSLEHVNAVLLSCLDLQNIQNYAEHAFYKTTKQNIIRNWFDMNNCTVEGTFILSDR